MTRWIERTFRSVALSGALAVLGLLASGVPAWSQSFVTFETGQVRPLALSGSRLFAINTPDDRLEIFTIGGGGSLTLSGSVPVGMEPIAVAARNANEVWVVNHLSDSVSIVDVSSSPPRVIRTLLVGDEPRDIVFAGPGGNRAFITTAHRGQNTPFQSTIGTILTTPGAGRADVWVFDATALGTSLGGDPVAILNLFSDTPRALAVSPDGATVYAAAFHSGNQTTALSEGLVCNGGPTAPPCSTGPGGLPFNFTCSTPDPMTANQPEVGLVVKLNTANGRWEDRLGRDWSGAVKFNLPDEDVFTIDAASATLGTTVFNTVGTVLFNMIVDPVKPNRVYVSNTDARNEVQFEGPGCVAIPSTVRGHLHEARITLLNADRKVRGKRIIVKDPMPGDPSLRRLILRAKEAASPIVIAGNPVANGATLGISVTGTTSSSQTFTLPSGASFWTQLGTIGYRFRDSAATTGIKLVLLKKLPNGVFTLKVIGKGAALALVPPNTGTSVDVLLTIGGVDRICTAFGGAAGGTIGPDTNKIFKAKNPSGDGACSPVSARHLNKHIDYAVVPSVAGVSDDSLAIPLGMAITPDGSRLYVAAFGSSKVGVFETSELAGDTFTPDSGSHIPVSGGPSGLVLNPGVNRLYVFTRFNNAVTTIDTTTNTVVGSPITLHNPEPTTVVDGRPFLYDASQTSSNGEAECAACHIFGDFDSLTWDLGDPTTATNTANNNAIRGPVINQNFRALKGPMSTQSLRGMANHGPMHWRGDRTSANCSDQDGPPGDPGDPIIRPACEQDAFTAFNVAFGGLLGRSGPLTTTDMAKFTNFILQVTYPPNPVRALDNSLNTDQDAGRTFFFGPVSDVLFNCDGCHVTDVALGFFGSDGFSTFENEPQTFKVPHLRNLYQKVGMFGMPAVPFFNPGDNGPQGDQVRGIGFLHDGSVDTLFRFHNAIVFNSGFPSGPAGDTLRRQVEQFMLAFPSNLAPIVGQQITLRSDSPSAVGTRIDLMIARAGDPNNECDVIVKGNLLTPSPAQRGWYRLRDGPDEGMFRSDKPSSEPLLTDAALRANAATTGQELTYTCVPPGSGERAGVDRDDDGTYDGEE